MRSRSVTSKGMDPAAIRDTSVISTSGPIVTQRGPVCRSAMSAHAVGAKLVAVEVAKVREVRFRGTIAGSTLVGAAKRDRLCVKDVYFIRRIEAECEHRAVTDRRRVPII